MNNLIAVILTIIFIVIVATLVIKKYNTVYVFLMSGIVVLLGAALVTGTSVMGDKTTGSIILDVFAFVANAFKSRASGVGMTLMMVTGYALYMTHIGASTKLAYLAMKPLKKIKNPYIVLSMLFVIGCLLKLVITSHSGLGMLLMSIAFPVLVSLGISRLSACAVMILTGFLDWGPNDSSAIFAAENVCGMPMMEYFLKYQGRLSLALLVIATILLPIYLSFMDKKMVASGQSIVKEAEPENVNCPTIYAIFPVIPLALVTIFAFTSIKMDVVTANLLGMMFVLFIEFFRHKDKKEASKDMAQILKSMGTCFANIVSILIAAHVFAEAVTTLGGITIMSQTLASIKSAQVITVGMMSLITFFGAMLLGSGNASWYAFGPLVPDVAAQMGVSAQTIALPMQLAPAMGRCMSPVAGVIIAVAGMAEVDVMDIVKICTPPAIVMFILNVLLSQLFV